MNTSDMSDLFIIGGGINGCGIARDAAGRGYSVTLAEQGDLASATSSASTKLFHGGLRYLEYFELRLVREALREREVLLRAMPHISWPMRFVLPLSPTMTFDSTTPASRLVQTVMPWLRGRRPAWMIRLGLFLYDNLGGRKILPGTTTLDLRHGPEGKVLRDGFSRAYEYSDCWVDDARLVVLNARDALARGARIMTRTQVLRAERKDGLWQIETRDQVTGQRHTHCARMLINAAGPWAGEVIQDRIHLTSRDRVRLVRGSHIVTRKLYDHDKCYFFQGQDGRIVFAIPYEDDFTLIGTTDADHESPSVRPVCTEAERDYLIDFVNRYFARPISPDDVVWTYSGVRPLHDDGASAASAATRDYTLVVDADGGAPVLHVFGGKITTYRKLAESALSRINRALGGDAAPWTAGVALPGGDFAADGADALRRDLMNGYPFLTEAWAARLVRTYGTEARVILGQAQTRGDLGRDFGATLTEAEVRWQMEREFAQTSEDVVWRRTKLGLRLTADEVAALDAWMRQAGGAVPAAAE